MPEQFIKVKNREVQPTSSATYSEAFKAPEGSCTNISNSNGDICRICHCESDAGNPLLSPCYCAGSLKYVHQTCLQQWLSASNTRCCELCKFKFVLQTKIKPIGEWRRLEMTTVERRRLLCAILFHFVAAVCVVWSLFVLIDRATEEVQKGLIGWPFWTKLVVVAVGFTGGGVFMYIQCRQYLQLFTRWKAHNRIILVQNAPDNVSEKPSLTPDFLHPSPGALIHSSRVTANIESGTPPTYKAAYSEIYGNSGGSSQGNLSFDLESNIREVLALDIERSVAVKSLERLSETGKGKSVFKSLPNLSASSENLLV